MSRADKPRAAAILRNAENLLGLGEAAKALALLRPAVAAHARHAGLAQRMADALHALGRLDSAVAAYGRALDLDPHSSDAWYGLGCVQLSRGAFGAAREALRATLALAPMDAHVHVNLAKALFQMGEVGAAARHYQIALALGEPVALAVARANLAVMAPGCPRLDNADALRLRLAWAEGEAVAPLAPVAVPAPADGRLRIGYLSSFFGGRNWMKPVWGAINAHDREGFAIHMFADGAPPSAESGYRDVETDTIHGVAGASNDALAAYIQRVGLDVLVDLNGYSARERLGVLMRRPAPVVVGWFNMFATTGIAAYDAIIGDAAVITPEEERYYVEPVHRVPGSYLAFEVLYPVPDVAPAPWRQRGVLTFGSFCSLYKITDEVVATWAALLGAAPEARLLLKNGKLGDPSTRQRLEARFHRHGIGPERLDLEGGAEHFAFLDAYARIDVALDSFPYNGGTTTMEALWQGVPVLAFNGDRWAARTSRSLLLAAGLDEWVADSRRGYLEKAVALAREPGAAERLAEMRMGMRARLKASGVCDGAGLARGLEAIYRELVRPHKTKP